MPIPETERLDSGSLGGTHARFPETCWSIIVTARSVSSPEAARALEILCRDYWYPVYAFIRRQGRSPHEAQDLTQGLFAKLLRHDGFKRVGPENGRFRTYILRCLTHYLYDERAMEQGPRRRPFGGIVPLENGEAEDRYAHEPADDASPDKLFQRRWVAALLDRVKLRLREECVKGGRPECFDILEPVLGERAERGSINEIARRLGTSEGAARVTLHRMRHRFGELLRETVAETLANPAEVDAEIRSLFTAWS